jgi:hypothetical protein
MLGWSAQQPVGPLNQFTALTQQTAGPLGQMGGALRPLPGDLSGLRLGISSASSGLNSLGTRFGSFQINIPTPQYAPAPAPGFGGLGGGPVRGPIPLLVPSKVPSRASGGSVEQDGFVKVHRGEDIVPARVTRQYRGGGNGGVTVNYNPSVTINGGGPSAKAEFAQMLAAHKDDIERMLTRRLGKGLERA